MSRHRSVGACLVVLAATLSGCGARTTILGTRSTVSAQATTAIAGPAAAAADVKVIRGWADALRRGDVAGAASYFAVPSQMINGTDIGEATLIRIRSERDAVAANESLTCGAKLVSAVMHGPFINALFTLTARGGPGGTSCAGGVGSDARTFFLIAHGHIVDWIRAPNSGAAPAPPGGSPPPAVTGPSV